MRVEVRLMFHSLEKSLLLESVGLRKAEFRAIVGEVKGILKEFATRKGGLTSSGRQERAQSDARALQRHAGLFGRAAELLGRAAGFADPLQRELQPGQVLRELQKRAEPARKEKGRAAGLAPGLLRRRPARWADQTSRARSWTGCRRRSSANTSATK